MASEVNRAKARKCVVIESRRTYIKKEEELTKLCAPNR